MKKYYLLLPILLLTLAGCANQSANNSEKGTTFNKYGLRFDCPIGWEINSGQQILDDEFQAICEKQGADESGLAIIKEKTSFISENKMLPLLMNSYRDQYQSDFNVALTFDDVDQKKIQVAYSFAVQDVKHKGIIATKKCPSSTLGIIFQAASQDYSKYQVDFEKISNSIVCQ